MKECSKCKQIKPDTEFYKDSKRPTGLRSWCKGCGRQWVLDNPHKQKYASAKWYANNPSQAKSHRRKSRYGMLSEQYSQLIIDQNNCCAICGHPFGGDGDGRGRTSPCVDHSHNTGNIRGLLCSLCNRMIGHAREDNAILLSAVDYLNKWGKMTT